MTLSARQLSVRYGSRTALLPCDLDLEPGRLVALIGPNGAGKTSLLRALAGLVPAEGSVDWDGRPLRAASGARRARTVAYLSQAPQAYWPMDVRELVALGRLPHRPFGRAPRDEDEAAVDWAMAQTGITAFAERPISQLSGGEAMRAQLARAFAVRAPVLLVDEPVANLDPFHQLGIMRSLLDYATEGRLVVAVMHDLTLAARHAARLVLLHAGVIVADGPPGDVLLRESVERYYGIDAYTTLHEGQLVAVPWRQRRSGSA